MLSTACEELGGHWWGGVSCPDHSTPWAQGASPHPPAQGWALTTPPWAPQGETQGWGAALPQGWKIAVGSTPSQGAFKTAFIIHSSLDDREKVRTDLKQNWPFL